MGSGHAASVESVWPDIARVVVSRQDIARRVTELAREISTCYADRELTVLAVLTGSVVFLADLMRELRLPLRLDVVSIRSYPGAATRSCGSMFRMAPETNVRDKHVLVIDDIFDSGGTLAMLMASLAEAGPASLASCVLIRKDRPDLPDRMGVDFAGFDVHDEFVVGYGMDHDDLYRNLPDICVLPPHLAEDPTP